VFNAISMSLCLKCNVQIINCLLLLIFLYHHHVFLFFIWDTGWTVILYFCVASSGFLWCSFFQNMCVGINKTRCSEISTMNRAAVQARCILEWALNMQPVWLQAIWWLSDFGCQLMLKHPVLVLLENSVFSQKNNRVSDLKKTHGYKLDWL